MEVINLAIVKTTVKGQVVIPANLRRKYHITKGSKVDIADKDGEIIIRPLLSDPIEQAFGILLFCQKEQKRQKNEASKINIR